MTLGARVKECVRTGTTGQRDCSPETQIRTPHRGSIYGVGGRFQSRRINDLELVDQTGIEPTTS